jgi:type I restriction enzyme S subunit
MHEQFMVRGPGVVTGRSGTIGRVHHVEDDFWPHNTTLWVTSFNEVDPKFAYYLLLHARLDQFSSGSGVPTLNRNDVHAFQVVVPTRKAEQVAIADCLCDVDGLIAALGRMIAKRTAVHQGMMQQLLTGETRLAGFVGAWRSVPFGELATPVKARTDPRLAAPNVLLVELENIDSGSGRLLGEAMPRDAVSLKTVFQSGDVLFGKLRAYLRKFWLADRGGICSTEIWALRPTSMATSAYVRYLVETERFSKVASGGYGTHMPRSEWGLLRNLEFPVPPLDEQEAIAALLRDAGRETELLRAHLAKAKALRQGMMRELLTGQTRLPVSEAAAA